jgi:hypothetical protein
MPRVIHHLKHAAANRQQKYKSRESQRNPEHPRILKYPPELAGQREDVGGADGWIRVKYVHYGFHALIM